MELDGVARHYFRRYAVKGLSCVVSATAMLYEVGFIVRLLRVVIRWILWLFDYSGEMSMNFFDIDRSVKVYLASKLSVFIYLE